MRAVTVLHTYNTARPTACCFLCSQRTRSLFPPARCSDPRMPPPVLLSPTSTLLISSAFTTAYVGSVYLFPHTRISISSPSPAPSTPAPAEGAPLPPAAPTSGPPRDRNHPQVIRARLCAVSLSSLLSALSIPRLVRWLAPHAAPIPPLHHLLGFSCPSTTDGVGRLVGLPLALTASLFAGSLYITWLCEAMPGQKRWTWQEAKREFGGWTGLRTLLVVSRSAKVQAGHFANRSTTAGTFNGGDRVPLVHCYCVGSGWTQQSADHFPLASLLRHR